MGLRADLSRLPRARQGAAALAASLQLASTARQPELPTTDQPPRPALEQPIGFTQLAFSNNVRVADAPRKPYPIEVFEHLDGQVAADAGAIAERGRGQAFAVGEIRGQAL